LAFGSNEVFRKLITYIDQKGEKPSGQLMPLSHVFLSGLLTGMVSTVALVVLVLFRLQLTTSEFFSKSKLDSRTTKAPSMQAKTFSEDLV